MLMHNGSDKDAIRLYLVKNREWKSGHETLPDFHSVNRACFGELLDAACCFFDCRKEV
jgi:hypothetical protein